MKITITEEEIRVAIKDFMINKGYSITGPLTFKCEVDLGYETPSNFIAEAELI